MTWYEQKRRGKQTVTVFPLQAGGAEREMVSRKCNILVLLHFFLQPDLVQSYHSVFLWIDSLSFCQTTPETIKFPVQIVLVFLTLLDILNQSRSGALEQNRGLSDCGFFELFVLSHLIKLWLHIENRNLRIHFWVHNWIAPICKGSITCLWEPPF